MDFQPPFALNGIISVNGEEDWFRFPAIKGVPLEVNVYARQLRSPLDSVLDIFDTKGRAASKLNAMVGDADIHRALHVCSQRGRDIVSAITEDYDLPLGCIAPCRADHPYRSRERRNL